MNYKIEVTARFSRELKRLSKKFKSLKNEYSELIISLSKFPEQGSPIGKSCYKIRLSIASKGTGKSGGARVITYVYVTGSTVYLLSIYDKSERDSISNKELSELLRELE